MEIHQWEWKSSDTVENSMTVPQTLKIGLPYNPAIPFLGIYPKNMKKLIWKDICTRMFIAALFTIAKYESKLSDDGWMNKEDVEYIYNGILLSH